MSELSLDREDAADDAAPRRAGGRMTAAERRRVAEALRLLELDIDALESEIRALEQSRAEVEVHQ